jgi:hypothetical protein
MKNEEIIPDHFPLLSEEDLKAVVSRREKYSLKRDIQAAEDNQAIARRLEKDKEDDVATETTSLPV